MTVLRSPLHSPLRSPLYGPFDGPWGGALTALPSVAVGPSAVYATTLLVAGYGGPCCRVVRASDSAAQDIGFVNGRIDMATAVTFAAGSELTIDILYDQTGQGRHATQVTAGSRPRLRAANAWRGLQGITFDSFIALSGGTQVAKFFNIPASVPLDRRAVTVLMVTAPRAGYNKNAHIELGTTTVTRSLYYSDVSNAGQIVHRGSGSSPVTTVGTRYCRSNPSVNGFRGGAAAATTYEDDNTDTGTVATAGSATGGRIGSSVSVLFDFRGEGFAYVIYPAALSDADVAALQASLKASHVAAATTQVSQLLFEGDSITEGAADTFLMNNMRLTYQALNQDVHLYNMSVHGTDWATEYARRVVKWGSFARAGMSKKIVVLGLGSNDMIAGVAATVWSTSALPYIQYIKSLGYILIVAVVLPRGDITAPQDTERLSFNQLIRDNAVAEGYTVCDYCANAAFDAQADASNGTNFFTDTIHPRTAGFTIMAGILAPLVNALL